MLSASGFVVSEEPFEYSQFPARWGPSIVGAMLAGTALLAGHVVFGHDMAIPALVILLACTLVAVLVGSSLARKGPLGMRWSRAASVNLVGVPTVAERAPRIWLVAHLDSKSQTIPMLVRMVAVAAFALLLTAMIGALIAMSVLSLGDGSGELAHRLMHVVFELSMLAALATLPLILCFIGNRSNGAVDNASGVAAVLLAAELLRAREDVGVVITSAEEFALAGAQAFVRSGTGAALGSRAGMGATAPVALNCDTVDDGGDFICMAKGRKPARLDAAIDRAASRLRIETIGRTAQTKGRTRLRAMLPGILADNIAFSDAGWDSFTLSRGNLATLARVHKSRDRAERIEGTGIVQAAHLLAATVEELS